MWTGLQDAVCNRTMQYALYLIFSHWIWLTCSIKINRIPQREICQAYEKVFFPLFVFSRQETDLNSAYFSLFPTANFSSPSLVVSPQRYRLVNLLALKRGNNVGKKNHNFCHFYMNKPENPFQTVTSQEIVYFVPID